MNGNKVYQDGRGWVFKVMPGLGESMYKARYKKPGKSGWHCVAVLPWRVLAIRAEEDLEAYAKKKGMVEVEKHDEHDDGAAGAGAPGAGRKR